LNPATPSLQYKQIIHANPGLKPEQGKVWYAGTVIDLNRAVKGLSLTIDYTNITINDAIVPISSFTTAQIFTYFPKLVVRNPTDNSISYFDVSPFNGTSDYYRGYDLGLDYKLHRTRAGDFDFSVQATRILYLAYDPGTGQALQNVVGRYGFGGEVQRWSGNAQVAWTRGRLGASLAAVYKGPVLADANGTVGAGSAWGVNPIALFNVSASCSAMWDTRLTLGCNNLLNTAPPANGRIGTAGFDLASYGAWATGRTVYVKLKKEF
jgi:iron complex outermembrane receptor protein